MTPQRGWGPIFSFLQTYLITDPPIRPWFFAEHLAIYREMLLFHKNGLENADIEDGKWLTRDQESSCIFASVSVWDRRKVSSPEIMTGLNGWHVFPAQMADFRCPGKQFCISNKYKVLSPSACSKTSHSMRLINNSKISSIPLKLGSKKPEEALQLLPKCFRGG